MIQQSEDGKVTMVDWNRNWQKFGQKQRCLHYPRSYRENWKQAKYHSVDVMDKPGMVELGKSLNRKITGVVHGAGLKIHQLQTRIMISLTA